MTSLLLNVRKLKVNVEEVINWINFDKKPTELYEKIDNDSRDIDELSEVYTQIRVKNKSAIKSSNVDLQWVAENDVAVTDITRFQKLKI